VPVVGSNSRFGRAPPNWVAAIRSFCLGWAVAVPARKSTKGGAAAFLIAFPLGVLAGFTLAWCSQERSFLALSDSLRKVLLIVGACFFGVLGLLGAIASVQLMASGKGIPADPVSRVAHLVGVWLCPVTLLAIAVACGTIAYVMATKPRP
jgi:hypothetical protein